jgi:high affinity sulfate transporter 1
MLAPLDGGITGFVQGGRHPPQALLTWVPGLGLACSYRSTWLPRDAMAGVILAVLLVPTGMAYAEAAGLPAVSGLYATIAALVTYAVFGPSRILVLGPDSSLAPLIAASVLPLAGGNPEIGIAFAGALSLITGGLCIVGGLLRLGFITDLLSEPVRYGYLNGIALTVLVGQLPKLLGFPVSTDHVMVELLAVFQGVLQGLTNGVDVIIGVLSLLTIRVVKRWWPRLPGVLFAVAGATVATSALDLAGRFGVAVVGPLPAGLPAVQLPSVATTDLEPLLVAAVGIAFVSFAETSVLARTYASRGGYRANINQELLALGVANLANGVCQGFPVSSSASRTPVAEAAGARSQLTGLVATATIIVLLIWAPGLLRNLPSAALAGIVIAAATGLMELGSIGRLYRLRPSEFALSIACFLGVVLFGVLPGVFLAIGLSVLEFLRRAWRPYDAVLGRVPGLKGYHDIGRHPEALCIPGLVLFRWDAPLFFANAEVFGDRVRRAVAESPTAVHWVVVAAEPVTDVDTTAADLLGELHEELARTGIVLAFAEMKGPVKDQLKRYGLFERFGEEHFFPTVGSAVHRYVAETGVSWIDWEEVGGTLEQERADRTEF